MLKNKNPNTQDDLYGTKLEYLIDLKHPLVQLSKRIHWEALEKDFEKFYNKKYGRPAKPIRLMTALLILKQMFNESDETLVERWRENPYWQYFSGEEYFSWNLPCEHSELPKFRGRIGETGVEKIFQESIRIHGEKAMEREIIPDTTAQEKNITFPTDTKLHLKVIKKCLKIGDEYGIHRRQSYKQKIKKLRFEARYAKIPSRAQQGKKAKRKIKTIAGRLYRELDRELPEEAKQAYSKELVVMKRILEQSRYSKNKVYSLHEPEVSCIAKGKEHKKYEFGSKASVLITKNSGIIVGALNFQGNPYDGKTLEAALEQTERMRGVKADKAIVDEGYRGRSTILDTEIIRVHRPNDGKYSKRRWRQWFRRRAAVEAVISHLKSDHRLKRNYLKGTIGDSINLMMSAAAFNYKKLMNELAFILRSFKFAFYPENFVFKLSGCYEICIFHH